LIKDGLMQGVQCLSGMSGLRLGMDMVLKYLPNATLYTSNETYPPHKSMAKVIGIKNKDYRYYDRVNQCLDF